MMLAMVLQLVVFILLFGGIYFVIKKQRRMGVAMVKGRSRNWFFTLYICALLICAAAFYLIPGEQFNQTVALEYEAAFEAEEELRTLLNEGRYEEAVGNLVNSFTFDYFDDVVVVNAMYRDYFDGSVIVDATDELDGEMEAYLYMGRSYVDGFDFTGQINAPHLVVHEDELQIHLEETNISFANLGKEFTISQFMEDNDSDDPFGHRSSSSYHGSTYIYLRVPAGVSVESADDGLYVEEVKR
ncbi:hypothetical protein [Alteribacter keqinensis]|uniref:Uncharacterized protein n=1 Tax=Alteribacter keqinensis TaxID=2483800 RepID=A0A3M7TTH3_9BACI|nr:hypothetical protein [Alteribacter keqinensis]RNA68589.1 hypothetical protein EBO34_01055 [Alteribacter keqinensis]